MNKYYIVIAATLISLTLATPSFADFKWVYGGDLLETFDDNVTSAHVDEKSDAITKATLAGGFTYTNPTDNLNFITRITQQLFAQHSSFNNTSEEVGLQGGKQLSEYDMISVTNQFKHEEDPSSFEDAFGRTSGRSSSYKNKFDITYARELTKQWNFKTIYRQDNDSYSRDDISDSIQYAPGILSEYALDSANFVGLGYDYAQRNFDRGGDVKAHNVYGSYRHFFTEQWSIDIKPGVTHITSVDGSSFTKPRYTIGLNNDLDERTKVNINFTQEYAAGSFQQDVFNNWRLAASLFRQLLAKLTTSLSVFYGQGTYEGSNIDEDLSGADISLQYLLTKNASLYTGYNFQNVASNINTREHTRNMLSFGIKVSF